MRALRAIRYIHFYNATGNNYIQEEWENILNLEFTYYPNKFFASSHNPPCLRSFIFDSLVEEQSYLLVLHLLSVQFHIRVFKMLMV
jgi:hypothetical protein